MKRTFAILLFASCAAFSWGQSTGPTTSKPHTAARPSTGTRSGGASRSECTRSGDLCISVPTSWKRLGDVFDDLGFVVAEQVSGREDKDWPQITAAAIDLPPQTDKQEGTDLDSLVNLVTTPDGSFSSAETMQRTRTSINGHNAEIIRVKLHDDATNSDSVEEVALIEDDEEDLVYSIALRCPPGDFARLDPVFQRAVRSWHANPQKQEPKADTPEQPAAPPKE